MVQTYVFWNAHVHKPNDWTFEFNTDLARCPVATILACLAY
jgi:hypothetical protein